MTAVFHVAHASAGRTRIRWAGDAQDKGSVIGLAANIESLAAVDSADPRITTGSIVIKHDQIEWPELQTQLADRFAMTFAARAAAVNRNGAEELHHDIDRLDGALKQVNMDFDSVTLLMLSTLAIIQALRGQVMSSSVSFLWYAFTLATMARDRADKNGQNVQETGE